MQQKVKVQREKVQDVMWNRLSEERAESVASCWEQAWRVDGERTLGARIVGCWQTLKIWQRPVAGREHKCWCGDEGMSRSWGKWTAISAGPACCCKGAPGAPERKGTKQKQDGQASHDSSGWPCSLRSSRCLHMLSFTQGTFSGSSTEHRNTELRWLPTPIPPNKPQTTVSYRFYNCGSHPPTLKVTSVTVGNLCADLCCSHTVQGIVTFEKLDSNIYSACRTKSLSLKTCQWLLLRADQMDPNACSEALLKL